MNKKFTISLSIIFALLIIKVLVSVHLYAMKEQQYQIAQRILQEQEKKTQTVLDNLDQ